MSYDQQLADALRKIERLQAALREAAIFLETAAPFLPDDVTVRHRFNNGETLQTRPLSVVLRACAKAARRALKKGGPTDPPHGAPDQEKNTGGGSL